MSCFDPKKLLLNTQRAYTMAMDKSGCEIYIPCIVRDMEVINEAQNGLREFLNNQPGPEETRA